MNHVDFAGRDALLTQVDAARVDRYCSCGCATVSLTIDPSAQAAGKTYRPIPNEAHVIDANGEIIGGVIAFVDHGYLSSLEIYSFDGPPITPFPPLDRLELVTRG